MVHTYYAVALNRSIARPHKRPTHLILWICLGRRNAPQPRPDTAIFISNPVVTFQGIRLANTRPMTPLPTELDTNVPLWTSGVSVNKQTRIRFEDI